MTWKLGERRTDHGKRENEDGVIQKGEQAPQKRYANNSFTM